MSTVTRVGIYVLLLIISLQIVAAIGISPARKELEFLPGQKQDVSFNIVNNEGKEFSAIVYVRGELEKHIKIKNPVLVFSPADNRKTVEFTLNAVEQLGKPGVHDAEIVVIEYPVKLDSEDNAPIVQATGSVVAKLLVRVPFPGKYAEADLHIASAQPKENVIFSVPIFNYGKEHIQQAKAVIRILGATYEKIAEIETESVSIDPKGQVKLTALWQANVNPGTYHAVAEIFYDNEKIVVEKNFNVGSLLVEIEKIDTGDFTLGDIAKFDITVASKWNEPITNVYGDVTVSDKKGTVYGTFKTATVDIAPFEREIIAAFWDTKGINVGTYDLKIAVYYADKVTERLIEAEVNIDSIRTTLGATGQVAAAKSSFGKDAMLVILVIFLIIINIGWFIYFRRTRNR